MLWLKKVLKKVEIIRKNKNSKKYNNNIMFKKKSNMLFCNKFQLFKK